MQEIFMWALNGVTGMFVILLWSVIRDQKQQIDKVSQELADHKTQSAEKFLTRAEMKDAVETINQAFERHANRIDVRMDRMEERLIEMKGRQ